MAAAAASAIALVGRERCALRVRGCRGSLSPVSKLVSIVCRARMVSTGDNEVYTGSDLRGVIPYVQCRAACSHARVVCSRIYKLVGRGCWTQVPWNGCSVCRMSNPCNGCPSLPFIDERGGVTREKEIRVTVSVTEMSSRTSLSVRAHSSGVVLPCRGSLHVAGRGCSYQDAWRPFRLVWR
jgi:hypothetical protein